jgi:glycosyltransferase involved in cell wall biosynthesis
MRRILIVRAGLYMGGAERMLASLVNNWDRTWFETVVATLDDDNPLASSIQPDAAELLVFARRWRYDLAPAAKLRQVIQERNIDAVLAFGLYEFSFVHVALLGLRRKPSVVVSLHSTRLARRRQHLQHWLYARLLDGSERLVSVCNAQADYCSAAYEIKRDRFQTIYNGVDVEHFRPSNDPEARRLIRRRFGIPENAPVVIKVAGLRPGKRHADAIQALSLMSSHGTASDGARPYLMILGGGDPEYEKQLRALAGRLGVADRVVFCGESDDVRPYLEAADVFTLTSSSVESFSVAALEAMAMGLPCVLTDVSGAREMIRPGLNGYLVPPESPLEIAAGWQKALFGPPLQDRSAIREFVVSNFALGDCVRAYERVLELPARTRLGQGKASARRFGEVILSGETKTGNGVKASVPGLAGPVPLSEGSDQKSMDEAS